MLNYTEIHIEIETYRERGHSGIADCLSSRLRTGLINYCKMMDDANILCLFYTSSPSEQIGKSDIVGKGT